MTAPDATMPSNATAGEWKAVLAPLLTTADSAEDVHGYLVITVNKAELLEMRTNMPDETVRTLMLLMMPGGGG
jgi:hypothetical protein